MAQPRRIDVQALRPAEDRRAVDGPTPPADLSKVQGQLEPGESCAYNQSKECVLALRVIVGDFSLASLKDWMATLTPNSAAGIWMVPFRGLLATDAGVPLDLLYLDENNKVLDAVEFFPTFRVSSSSPAAASVLALPSHSIFASQTQRGDRLMLCSAEEMKWRLDQLTPSDGSDGMILHTPSGVVPGPMLVRDEPKKAPAPVWEEPVMAVVSAPIAAPPEAAPPAPAPASAMDRVAAGATDRGENAQRGWISRLFRRGPAEPRKATREPLDGLVAHFFTGGNPQAHEIRDVSTTGLYVVTTERWYIGTVIRMTLSKPDVGQHPSERSITINARSVRWGNDGVGLEFVVEPKGRSSRSPVSAAAEPVDAAQLDYFLKTFPKGKR